MSNLNLKGLWIPIEILTDKNLSDKEKHIYSLVIFLSQEKQYCFCTNKTISELLNISVTQVTNFDKTKEELQNMKLELPDVPDIDDIRMARWSKKRDEKILEDSIKPKDDLIKELYQNNLLMNQQLLRQAKMVEEAEKYQKERNKIIADNIDLHKQVDNIKAEYQQKEDNLEWKYEYRINKLEKENGYLHKVIDKFRETIHKFVEWICVNFDMGTGDTLIRDFERETRTYLDAEEQIKREEREKDLEMER